MKSHKEHIDPTMGEHEQHISTMPDGDHMPTEPKMDHTPMASHEDHSMMNSHGGGLIMDSVSLMTAIDVAIIALTIFSVWSFYSHRKMLGQLGVGAGVVLCLGGLLVMALFYIADLYTMFVLPQFMPMADAMQIMNNLHLNYKWIVTVVAIGMIVSGIIYLIRILLPKISSLLEQLKSDQNNLEKEVEERTNDLTKALQEAKQANEVKSIFLSQMSHELRTPLNAVIGYSELLLEEDQDKSLSQQQQSDMRKILGSGQHLLNLINDLLDLSKLELGNIDLDMKNIDIMASYLDCKHIITPLLDSRQISFENQTPEGTACTVYADKRRLDQILINLFTNAIKYNSESGAVIFSCETPIPGRLRINVTDMGEGISEEFHDRIFNTFDRLDKGVETDGSGIGLAVTRHLVEAMGGCIGFESSPEKGSTFWFELAAPTA